jgi:AhpD family alkylhydroperoxidase
MSRLPPAAPRRYEPYFGLDAPLRLQVWAHAPEVAIASDALAATLQEHSVLPTRLAELFRLRIAFHNQCRTCMASRYADARDAGVTEDLVCSLERPAEADDLTVAERLALEFADRFANDHLSIGDEVVDDLRRHFTDAQVMELLFRAAYLVGHGRMQAILDVRPDELPERFRVDGRITPWGEGELMERPRSAAPGSAR